MKALLPNKFIVPGLTGLTSGLLIAILFHALVETPPNTPLPVPVKEDESESLPRHDYVGEVRNGVYHGRGTLTFDYGNKYVGEFKDGEFHGHGVYTWERGGEYTGEWEDGEENGYGIHMYADGHEEKYVGEWKNGDWHGHGTLTYADGTVVEGEWAYGLRYNPETEEYSCDTHPHTVETGSLRIEVHEGMELVLDSSGDGTNIPDCWWVGDERFTVYRGDTKLVEIDERNGWNDSVTLRFETTFPRHPENFPVVVNDNEYVDWQVEGASDIAIPPEYDVTGDGSPNLIVGGWTGGAHCCQLYYVLDVGETPRLVDVISTEHSDIARLYKFEDTPGLTLLANDWNYAYWNTCFACSPAPIVYLSFNPERDEFVINTDKMKSTVPEQETLDEWVEEIQQYWEHRPELLWTYMLELIYTGNLDAAKELLDRAWPSKAKMKIPFLDDSIIQHVFEKTEPYPTSKDEFWHGLLEKISESQFAEEIFLMNAPNRCSVGPLLSLPNLERHLCTES